MSTIWYYLIIIGKYEENYEVGKFKKEEIKLVIIMLLGDLH